MLQRILQDGGPALSQSDFAALIFCDRSVVCRLVQRGIVPGKGKWLAWWLPYRVYLLGVIAGKRGSDLYPVKEFANG